MRPTRLRLFGRPAAIHAGSSIELPAERRSQLLIVLALRRAWVSRGELASLLWPGHPGALALTNVRKALHGARAWPWANALETQGSALRLEIATDVHDFELALQEGRLADATGCCGGALLDGLDDLTNEAWTEWLDGERADHARRWHGLTRARLRQLQSKPDEAVVFARDLLAADPLDEDAVVALLSALVATGRLGERHEVYRAYAERLAEGLGVEPSLRVRQLVRNAGPASAGPTSWSDGFVGRARELQDLFALLARDECRLLTVTGPGGAGKSRLLKQSLRPLEARVPDGVLWLALDDLDTLAQVASRLAAELRIAPGAADDPLPLVCDALRSRAMLLVLDNGEHLTELARLIERLLEAASAVKICVTSRVRLHAAGEWLLPLHGLLADDAVALFTASARAVKPDFDAAAQHAAIVALVESLGGLPLAVLLAANWARLLPVAEIAADLERSLALLDSDDDGEERPEHRSVRATFEQSWRMLAPRERRALSLLSVFVGGFSRVAAQEVAEASAPLLGTLADKSLLQIDAARCALHPLLRRFSSDKLDASAHADALQRHAAWFHRRLEQLASASNAGDSDVQQEIEADLENCRAAWHWAVAHGALPLLGASALALMRFFEVKGGPPKGSRCSRRRCRCARPPARAGALMLEVLERQRALGDWIGVVIRLNDLAALHQASNEWSTARRYLQEGLSLSEQHGIAFVRPHLLINLALVSFFDGRLDDAEQIGRQVLSESRLAANRQAEATALLHLVHVAVRRADLDGARTLLADAFTVAGVMASVPMQLDGVFCFAEILAAEGDTRAAAALLRYYVARPEIEPGDRALGEAGLVGLPVDAPAPDVPLDALLEQLTHRLRVIARR